MKDLTRYCVAMTVTKRGKGSMQGIRQTGPRKVTVWALDPDSAIGGARQIMRDALLGDLIAMQVDTCRVAEVC